MGSFAAQTLPLADNVTLTVQREGYDQTENITVSVSSAFPCRLCVHEADFLDSFPTARNLIPLPKRLQMRLHGAASTANLRTLPMGSTFTINRKIQPQDCPSASVK